MTHVTWKPGAKAAMQGINDLTNNGKGWPAPPAPILTPADALEAAAQVAEDMNPDIWDRDTGEKIGLDGAAEAIRALASRIPPDPQRCAECNCQNGGAECNWIKSAPPVSPDVAWLERRLASWRAYIGTKGFYGKLAPQICAELELALAAMKGDSHE